MSGQGQRLPFELVFSHKTGSQLNKTSKEHSLFDGTACAQVQMVQMVGLVQFACAFEFIIIPCGPRLFERHLSRRATVPRALCSHPMAGAQRTKLACGGLSGSRSSVALSQLLSIAMLEMKRQARSPAGHRLPLKLEPG